MMEKTEFQKALDEEIDLFWKYWDGTANAKEKFKRRFQKITRYYFGQEE